MSLMDKIRKVLDEKIQDKKDALVGEAAKFTGTIVAISESGEITVENEENKKFSITLEGEFEVGAEVEVDESMSPTELSESEYKDDDEMEDEEEDDMKDEKKDKKKKEKVDMKEALAKIFKEAKIDESIAEDLTTLFNVVVAEKVDEIVAEKSAEYEAYQEEKIAEAIEEMTESVDKYLSYTATEWLKENEVQVETGIKLEVSENLIKGLKGIFEDSYVEVPESKVDLVKEAEETIDNLLTTVDEEKERADTLQTELNTLKAKNIVDEVACDLTDVQKEKLGTLIDSVEYTNDSEYKKKVEVVVENYFKGSAKDDLNEGHSATDEGDVDDRIAAFAKHLRRPKTY